MADEKDDMTGIARGLAAIDKTIRDQAGGKGPVGSGLYYLLDHIAVTHLGVPRRPFPIDAPKPAPEPANRVEPYTRPSSSEPEPEPATGEVALDA
jgi:hypothetical protein